MYKKLRIILTFNKNRCVKAFVHSLRKCSTEVENIIIPKAIPRGTTDILKALASTVRVDHTAPNYKYHDDPFLTPFSNLSKRSYALSQEAGRKAAQWVRQEQAELFQHRVAEPIIEAFLPKPIYNEESETSEEVLKNTILNLAVTDSITIYELLKKKGIEISREVKQSLLELVCYYNSTDKPNEEWVEERWFQQMSKTRTKNIWTEGGFADKLFNEIGDQDSKSYSAVISGMCLHGHVSGAWKLYDKAKSESIKLNITVYNALLANSCFYKSSPSMAMDAIKALLNEMREENIRPDLGTLNSILQSLSHLNSHAYAKTFALNILAELKSLGIEPSLASFYHMWNLYSSDQQLEGLIVGTLSYLENVSIEIVDPNDVLFFSKAMETIAQRVLDVNLAYRLNDLLNKDDNYNFIGSSHKESIYYRNYFFVLMKTEPLDVVMEVYNKLVPNIYIPEPVVTKVLLKLVDANSACGLLPKLWTDVVLFEQADRSSVFEHILSIACKNTDDSLDEKLANIAWSMWEKLENPEFERAALNWTGAILGDIMTLTLNVGNLNKAHLVLAKMRGSQNIIGEPNVSALIKYVDTCLKVQFFDDAINCVHYCNEVGFLETDIMARKVFNTNQLNSKQLERLVSIVGEDVLKPKQENKSSEV